MKNFFRTLILLSAVTISISGCKNSDSDNSKSSATQQTTDSKTLNNSTSDSSATDSTENNSSSAKEDTSADDSTSSELDLSSYEGIWTKDGITEDNVIQNGGAYLELTINDDNSVSGTYGCIQETTQRISSITFDNLTADNSYSYAYDEDDFYNSGVLSLSFGDDSISVTISDVKISADNSSGWTAYTANLIRPSDNDSENSGDSTDTSNADTSSLNQSLNEYLESPLRTDISYSDSIFESDTRNYTSDELSSLSKDMLSIFRNEIYARHGKVFDSEELNEFFQQFDWYSAGTFNESDLNDYEQANLDLAVQMETELGYR